MYYNKYKKNGIKPPQDVTKYTDEYQKQCDIYIDFIKNSIEFTDNESDTLCISEVHDEFKMCGLFKLLLLIKQAATNFGGRHYINCTFWTN